MKKLIMLLYGVTAYIIFLVAFSYAIGFLGNFAVPKSIDSGRDTSSIQALIFDSLLLSLFALQHSLMARPAFKKWWAGVVDPAIERSTYVLLSSLVLLLLYWQWQPVSAVAWHIENKTTTLAINTIFFLGWMIVFLSTLMINHFELFGIKQIFENMRNNKPRPSAFKVFFFYRIVRHPIMLGFIIAFWATPVMTIGHLAFSIITTLYILIAIKFLEEKDLLKYYGKEYEQYQKEVPMIIPFTGKGN